MNKKLRILSPRWCELVARTTTNKRKANEL